MLQKLKNLFADRRKKLELIIGLVFFLFLSGAFFMNAFESLELLSLDGRFQLRGPRPFPEDIALILIDEESLDTYGRWPWSRDKHAALIRLLNYDFSRPRVLGFDVLLEYRDEMRPEADEDLLYWIKAFEGDVLMSYFFEWGHVSPYERDTTKEKRLEEFSLRPSTAFPRKIENADKVSLPFLELAQMTRLAFVNDVTDPDGRTRRLPLLINYQGRTYPSFALLAALRYLGVGVENVRLERRFIVIEKDKRVIRKIPVTPEGHMLVNFYGVADRIRNSPYVQILKRDADWQKGGRVPEEILTFKDKLVLVGVSALGEKDRKVTPFFSYDPGVSVQAQAIANILQGAFLTRMSRSWANALFLFMGLVTIFATMFLRISRSLPAVIGIALTYFLVCQFFFLEGIWIEFAAVEISIAIIFTAITCFRYFTALEELKRTQDQLIHSAKMASLGQLSAGIAHEFRNILNAVNMHVEFSSLPGTPPERVKDGLGKIKNIMASASRILNGLLTFARKNESVKTPGSLKKTVEDTLLLVEKEMMRHEIVLSAELEDVPEFAYDSGQISQVIMNLINNGRDALKGREGKEIKVTLKNLLAGARLDIADNGCGIPPAVMKRLFEPFVTSKPAGQGTGLGLSVCHGIIRNHGGDITVTTAVGKGTVWHISLPRG